MPGYADYPTGHGVSGNTGLNSIFANGATEGMGHVLYKEGKLYILNGNASRLYIADGSSFKPGDAPRAASSLESEDIGTFVRSLNLTNPINSNVYQLVLAPMVTYTS